MLNDMDKRVHTWQQAFVDRIYATHNRSARIESALLGCLAILESQAGAPGLNIGSGTTRLHPRLLNLDLNGSSDTDLVGNAEALPFREGCFALLVSQETFEHIQRPDLAVREAHRVLVPGGTFFFQVPFMIGYHPGPQDYWRFTRSGIQELIERGGFSCETVVLAVGPATGFYRILVEFIATIASRLLPALYRPVKGLAALVFFPLKWLDPFLGNAAQADRIAGGYYVIARKPSC
jgi:SAM-dependent methyltransferase